MIPSVGNRLLVAARSVLRAGVIASAMFATLVQSEPAADTLPSGGQITAGSANIAQDGASMTITQHSDRMIAEWQDFSIGRDAQVEFVQPGTDSAALNRVVGGRPSEIFGSLTANGRVLLVNQAGIHFANGSRLDVGGLVASTLDLADQDFLDGKLHFSGNSSAGSITAEGEIAIQNGGRLAFVAPLIEHRGTINADGGEVTMAAAEEVELSLGDTGLVSLKINRGALNAAIENGGAIDVGGGAVVLTAEGLDELTRGVVNNTGIVEANGLSEVGGRIVLKADGAVENAGGLAANSERHRGGLITVEADEITLTEAAELTATGATGGGDILIGGDWQGGVNEERRVFDDPDALMEATTVTMASGATIDASATDNGDGGTVVLWSDVSNPDSVTSVHGEIYARGGANGGDGGQIETSGAGLVTAGVEGSAAAANGIPGEWLFDPTNMVIGGDLRPDASTADPSLNDGNSENGNGFNGIAASSIVNLLNGGTDVTVTTQSSATELGDITVVVGIEKTSGDSDVTLTLRAANSIIINEDITNTGGSGKLNLVFDADNDTAASVAGTSPSRDGGGITILEANLSTGGGGITFGGTVESGYTGGDLFVGGGSTALTVNTGGGSFETKGQLIVANSSASGFSVLTGGGNITIGGAVDSGNEYSFVDDSEITASTTTYPVEWSRSEQDAQDKGGYLVTITSALENQLASAATLENGDYRGAWIGVYRDKDNSIAGGDEYTWRYAAGSPEAEEAFFQQNPSGGGGTAINGRYNNFDGDESAGEPNASGNGAEWAGQFFGNQALWNDLEGSRDFSQTVSRFNVLGYVLEKDLGASNLNLNTGSGQVSIGGGIGTSKALGSLDVIAATTTVTGDGVLTTNAQTYDSQLTLNSADLSSLFTLEAGGIIDLKKSLTSASNLLVEASGNNDVLVGGAITNTSSSNASATTIRAGRHIRLGVDATVSATQAAIDTQFWADTNADGDGIIYVESASIVSNGGDLTFGEDGQTADIAGSSVLVGGDVFFQRSTSAQTLTTDGGDLNIYGETIVANTDGVTLNTTSPSSDGAVVLHGLLNSGNGYSFAFTDNNDPWTDARTAAKGSTGGGSAVGDSYLVTITSRLENSIAGLTADYQSSWIGAFRDKGDELGAGDNKWYWADGPEADVNFFTQNTGDSTSGGTAVEGYFEFFANGEPNGTGNTGESFGQFYGAEGRWNDLQDTGGAGVFTVKGYVTETNLAASPVTINAGAGAVTLNGGVGTSKALETFDVSASSTTVIGNGIITTGAQTYSGSMTVNSSGSTTDVVLEAANNSITVSGPIAVYGGQIEINDDLISTATGDIYIASSASVNPAIEIKSGVAIEKTAGSGTLTLQAYGRILSNGSITASGSAELNVIFWSDYDNTNDDGGASSNGAIITNGGHVWMGGSSTNGGSMTWNGLTVGDGPSVGTNGYNFNALDIYGDVTTSGGDFFAWAGDGYSSGIDGIGNGSGTATVATGTGDITLIADEVVADPNELTFTTSGQFTLAPNDNAFASPFDWNAPLSSGAFQFPSSGSFRNVNVTAGMSALTIGRYTGAGLTGDSTFSIGNTSAVTISEAIDVDGSIFIESGGLDIDKELSATGNITAEAIVENANIVLSGTGSIVKAGGSDATVTLKTDNIELQSGSSITSTAGRLNVILWAEQPAAGSGVIELDGTTISTNGGGLIMAGSNSTALWTPYEGAADITIPDGLPYGSNSPGLLVKDSTITTAGGNLRAKGRTINNTGSHDNFGTHITGSTIATAAGDQSWYGTYGRDTGTATYLAGLEINASSISSTTGDIAIHGQIESSGSVTDGSALRLGSLGGSSNTTATGNVSIESTLGNITLLGDQKTLNVGGTGYGLSIETFGADNVTIGSQGGDITLTGNASSTTKKDRGIHLNGAAANAISVTTGGGSISLIGGLPTGDGAGDIDHGIHATNVNLVTTGSGTIMVTGDASNSASTGAVRGMTLHATRVQSDSGAINITGTAGEASANSRGITVENNTLKVLSASGAITLVDEEPAVSTGTYNGLSLAPSSNNSIVFGADGTNVVSSSSDLTIRGDNIGFGGNVSLINTSGAVVVESVADSFAVAVNASKLTVQGAPSSVRIGKNTNTGNVTTGDITAAGPINVYGGAITINEDLNTSAGTAAGDVLLKASDNIVIDTAGITTDDGDVILWANSDDNDSGMVFIDTATIQSSGGHLWIGGGAQDATAWNGLTVGDGYAVGNAEASNGFTLIGSTLNTGDGDIAVYGKGRAGSASFDIGITSTNSNGIRLLEGNTIDSGAGTIYMEGIARGTDGSSNGIEFSMNSNVDTIQSANTTADAIYLEGNANSTPGDVSNAWGVYTWNAVIQATGSGGGVTIKGSGSKQNGIMVPSSSAVLAKSGPITLIGTGYGSGADAVGIAGTVGRKTGTGVTTSSSDVTIQGDTFDITGSIATSGSVVIEPYGTSFAADVTSPNGISSDISGLTLGKAGNTRKVTIDADTTVAGPITIYSDNLFIDAVLTATNDRISLIGAGASNFQGTLETLSGADITADELLVRNFNRAYVGTKSGSSVGTVSVNTVASDGGDWLLLENDKALTIGSVGDVDDVTAASSVNVATRTGNLNVDQSVQATAAGGSIVLNAGKSESAGTGSGGNIIISDGATVGTGSGGRARLYTGTVAGSAGVTDLVGSGSGDFRYNADESTDLTVGGRTNIGTSGTFAIYREQPTVTGTIESATITYGESTPTFTLGSAAGLVNGDTSSPTITGGTTSGAGLLEVKDGGYAIIPSALSGLGYDVTGITNGTLTVNAKSLSVTGLTAQDKTYDGTDAATLNAAGSLDGVETGDTVSFTTASTFNDENVEPTKTLDLDYTLAGADSGNYTLADETGVATAAQITAKAIAVTAEAKSKTYGSADPTLSYTTDVSLVSGDSFTGALSRATGEDVGTYAINQGALAINDGNGGNNYTLTYTGADLTINPLAITVTADAKTKTYGNADPALTYSANVSLISGDKFTGALSRAAGENVGTYAISQNTLAIDDGNGGNNYTLTYVSDDLEITKRSVTLTAPSVSKTYDGNNLHETTQANLDALSAQLVRGDRITTAEILYDNKNAGAGKTVSINSVTLEDGNSGNNYNVGTTSDTSGEIIKAPLTITAVDDAEFVTKTDNRANYGGVIYDGFVAGETAADLAGLGTPEFTIGTVERSNDSVTSAGFYPGVLEPTGFAADNYELTVVDGDYTIVPADALLVRAGTTDVTYGASPSYSPIAEYLDESNDIISSSTGGSGLTITVTDGVVDVDDSAGGSAQFDITIQSTAADLSSSDNLSVGGYQLASENAQVTGENFGSLMFVGALQVAPKTLNNDLGISSVEKVYDGTRAITGFDLDIDRALAGVIGADAVTVAGSGTFNTRHVGEDKAINISLALRGDDAENYALASASFSDTVGTITQLESVEWVGADGADWSDSGNWAGGALPDQSNVGEILIPNAAISVYNADDFGATQSLITNNGVIRFDSANDFTLANLVAGAGTLEQNGTGKLTLSGSSASFTGSLAINAGEVLIDDDDALGAAPTVSGTGGTLSLGNGVTLPSLVTSGELLLGSDITTLGGQTHDADLVLAAGNKVGETVTPLEITTTNADIILNGSLTAGTGAKAAKRSVSVDAGTGAVTVNAQVGQDLRDGDSRILWTNYNEADINPFRFTVKGSDIALNADVTTFEEQRYEGPVSIGSTAGADNLRLLVSLDPAVRFTDTINDATANGGVHGLAVYAVSSVDANDPGFVMPVIDFAGAIGQTNPLERLIAEVGMQDQDAGALAADIDLSDRSDADTFFGEVRIAEDVWTSSPTQRYVGRNVRLGRNVEFATSAREGGWSPEFTRGINPSTGASLPFTNYSGGSGPVTPVFRASKRLPGEPDFETLGPNLGLMKLLAAADTSNGTELLDMAGIGQGLLMGDVAVGEVRTAQGDAPPLCDDDPDDPDCVED